MIGHQIRRERRKQRDTMLTEMDYFYQDQFARLSGLYDMAVERVMVERNDGMDSELIRRESSIERRV